MKRMISTLLLAATLFSTTANAGILILTGDIGNKFKGYKAVGWLTIILTGATVLGLIVDEDSKVNGDIVMPELSEASLAKIENATAEARSFAQSSNSDVVTTISADLAAEIVSMEGLEDSAQGQMLFRTLTSK